MSVMPLFSPFAPHFSREAVFPVGSRLRRADRILPVFLPFAGCPGRCVFCAQDRQTGSGGNVDGNLRAAAALLDEIRPEQSIELAFYGGTFTALPAEQRKKALALYTRYRNSGKVNCGRCSTRPDALGAGTPSAVLRELAEAGLDLVELGVQSFSDTALHLARRGYDGTGAEAGCRAVPAAGLKLGIQLLPGMPGVTPEVFLHDVDRALELRPACLRFYPCLVPEGTELAGMWRAGNYAPWTEEETVAALGEGLRRAWEAGVPVIRLAVAPEPVFDTALLAGPRHPALGGLIRAEALLRTTERALRRLGGAPGRLYLPRACQGYMYGHKGALRARWAALGLPPERIVFTAGEDARLCGPPETH